MLQQSRMYRRLGLITCLVVLSIIISACGGDDQPTASGSGGASTATNENEARDSEQSSVSSTDEMANSDRDADSSLANLPPPEVNELALPNLPELEGSLLFTRGKSLYFGAFDGESAEFLVSDISAATVDLSPDGHYAAYTSPGVRRLKMLFHNLATNELTELAPISGYLGPVAGQILGWSPDGQWVIVNDVIGLKYYVVSIDGATAYELGALFYPMWLDDNRVLLIEVDRTLIDAATAFEPQMVVGASIFDPQTGETADLNLDMSAVAFPIDYNGISVTIQSEGLNLAPVPDIMGYTVVLPDEEARLSVQLPDSSLGFTPEQCTVWTIDKLTADGMIETAYTAPEIMWITDLTLLPDKSVLFLEWSSAGCSPDGMRLVLKRLMPTGEVIQVVDGISRIEDGRNNLNLLVFNQGHRYTVSPDGQFVVWPSGDIDHMPARLNLTDINTGDTLILLEANSSGGANAFMDNDMFGSVFWVAD